MVAQEAKLRFDHVSYTYEDGEEALHDITLRIRPNEITAVFGPASAGKSTLLRLMNRLNDLVPGRTLQGTVAMDGQDIYSPDVDVNELRRRVGMVFATPVPLPMTIRQNLTYGPRLAGTRSGPELERLVKQSLSSAALLEEVEDRLDEPARDLSGGQQQRLCLARTLALEPEVILLDEPTSGLDPISTAKVEASLQALKHAYTVVIVPHSVQQAARVADHAVFLLEGELIEQGPGSLLFTRPADPRTEGYVTGRFG
jgi:phosphate transport system ATP-binding protein